MNWLFPRIGRESVGRMLKLAGLGALMAGVYGIVHDQITFTLSGEYFTEFKFHQFHYADFGFPDRVFVGVIGFLATWWVGMIAGWALARLADIRGGSAEIFRIVLRQFPVILLSAATFGVAGFFYGSMQLSSQGAESIAIAWGIPPVESPADFIRVGYIHNFGYAGALIGLIVAGIRVWKEVSAGSVPRHHRSIA